MKKIVISTMTIILFFSGISGAEDKKIVNKTLESVTSSKVDEKSDLTKEQLKNCILLQKKLDKQAKIIKQANSELKSVKEEIDKRAGYIKEKRSQVDNLNNKQIEDINNIIIKQKQAVGSYNTKIDYFKEKFDSFQVNKKSLSTNCADRPYNDDDMKAITVELEKKADKYSLTINLTPVNGKIRIMNIGPKYKNGILLKPGKYDIYITHSGYQEYRKWIKIEDSDVSLDVVLQKK